MSTLNKEQLAAKWNAKALELIPGGSVVMGCKYMSDGDMEQLGIYTRPLIITLKRPDGSLVDIYPMADDEGNNGGSLHMWSPDGEPADDILPTL